MIPPAADLGELTRLMETFNQATDRLGVFQQGTGPGEIHVAGGDQVMLGDAPLGTITSPGVGGDPLTIRLADTASAAAVQQLVRNLTFENVSSSPSTTTRKLRLALRDALGDVNPQVTKMVNVVL